MCTLDIKKYYLVKKDIDFITEVDLSIAVFHTNFIKKKIVLFLKHLEQMECYTTKYDYG